MATKVANLGQVKVGDLFYTCTPEGGPTMGGLVDERRLFEEQELVVTSPLAPFLCVAGGCFLCGTEFYEVVRRGTSEYPSIDMKMSRSVAATERVHLGLDTVPIVVFQFASQEERDEGLGIVVDSCQVDARIWLSQPCREGRPSSSAVTYDGTLIRQRPERGTSAMCMLLDPVWQLTAGLYDSATLMVVVLACLGLHRAMGIRASLQFVSRANLGDWWSERAYFINHCAMLEYVA